MVAVGSTPTPNPKANTADLLYYVFAFAVAYREEVFRVCGAKTPSTASGRPDADALAS
jgi:hypothetical protein